MASKYNPDSKPFPKTSKGQVDKERLKAEWIESTAMTLHTFCKEKGYDKDLLLHSVPCASWRRDKIAKLVAEADETAENTAVHARTTLIYNQLRAIQEVPTSLFGVLRLYEYMVKKEQNAAAQEIQDTQTGKDKAEGYKSPFKLKPGELKSLAAAGKDITEAIQRALYIEPAQPSVALTLIQNVESMAASSDETASGEKKQVQLLGAGPVDPKALAAELHALFDRPQAPGTPGMPEDAEEAIRAVDAELVDDGDEA